LISIGAAWCFTFNGFSFLAVIATLYMIRPGYAPPKNGISMFESVKEGIRFIRDRPGMVPLIALAFLMTFMGFPLLSFLPVFADQVFKGGSGTYAAMLVCSGAGSVCGALCMAWLGKLKHQGRAVLIALCILGVLM